MPNSRKESKVAQSYTYDPRGNIIGICDGNETKYMLDDWGRITQIVTPEGGVEKYTYDYAGNIITATDANGGTITYSYNSLGQVCEIKGQEGNSEYLYYDLEENLAETIDRNGSHIFYGYNIDKNITYRKEKDESSWETFDYNEDGTLRMATVLGMAYSYSYTKDGLLKSKLTCGRELLSYQYDKNGNTLAIKDISGKATSYTYDVTGRVVNVLDKDKKLATYSYNSDDSIKTITYGNGITTKYSYDGDKNIRSLITENSKGEILIDFNYVYDLNGNRLEKKGSKHQSFYTYDSLNRLTSAKYNTPNKSLEESFTYDKAGNRLTRISKEGIERYKYNAKNQLIELQRNNGITSFFYDKEGNLLKENSLEGTTSYSYNAFNQTIKAVTKEGNNLISRYDAEGLRYEIEENEKLTRFIFNKEDILVECDKDYKTLSRFARGYEVVNSEIEETKYYYHQEEQGSTFIITNEEEEIENSYFYDAFGVLIEQVENIPNRITYTGHQYDQITQQYHLRARNYNPVIGRFTQEDTYRGDGLNLYAYCGNNPVIYYDPSGFMACLKKTKSGADKRTYNNYKKLREQGFTASEAYGYMKAARNAKTNSQREQVGEGLMEAIMKKQNYSRLPSKVEGNHGIDGVFVKLNKNGDIKELVIGEANFGSSRLGKTSMGRQMSDSWIEANIVKMQKSKDLKVKKAGDMIDEFISNGGKYKKEVFRTKLSGFFRKKGL